MPGARLTVAVVLTSSKCVLAGGSYRRPGEAGRFAAD